VQVILWHPLKAVNAHSGAACNFMPSHICSEGDASTSFLAHLAFSSGEARRDLIASILEENKHRGNATCANNYGACPKRVLQQSLLAKSLVSGTTEGRGDASRNFTDNVCVRSMDYGTA